MPTVCPKEQLEQIDVPAGLDLGSETPAEIALSILATIVSVRRGKHAAPAARPGRTRSGAAAPPSTLAIDPICGMTVAAVEGTPSLHVDGETIYFCCEGCATEFEKRSILR